MKVSGAVAMADDPGHAFGIYFEKISFDAQEERQHFNPDGVIETAAKALADKRYMHCGGALADTLVKGQPNWSFCVDDARIVYKALNAP